MKFQGIFLTGTNFRPIFPVGMGSHRVCDTGLYVRIFEKILSKLCEYNTNCTGKKTIKDVYHHWHFQRNKHRAQSINHYFAMFIQRYLGLIDVR